MTEFFWGLVSIISLAMFVIWDVRRRPPIKPKFKPKLETSKESVFSTNHKGGEPQTMTTSDEEWKAHFESLETAALLDLLASPSVKHHVMVRDIITARGLSPDEIDREVQQRKTTLEETVSESSHETEESSRGHPFKLFLILMVPAMVLLGIYYLTEIAIFLHLSVGVIAGIITGTIGGYIGGAIGGYIDPMTQIADFAPDVRMKLAKTGSGTWVMGTLAGMITGTLTCAVGDISYSPGILIAAWFVFRYLANLMEMRIGESVVGFRGSIVGGAVAGVLGGTAGVLLIDKMPVTII